MYTIENDWISVVAKSDGAELTSIKTKTDDLEYLWQADKKHWSRHAPVLFPFVGRLKNDCYTYNGRTYFVGQHGFARDKEFILSARSENYLEFSLRSDAATRALYPFDFELRIGYRIENCSVAVEYTVINTGSTELLFSIGAHPGFNIPLFSCESIEDYVLQISQAESASIHLLDGPHYSGQTELFFANQTERSLTRELFKNDALVFKGLASKTVSLVNKASGKGVAVDCENWPYVGVWMPPAGAPFVCIEPWYGLADNIKHDGELESKEGIISLPPAGQFACRFVIRPL
ncbi:MAG: aldose 1-epimerase family protein [Negativicutes bacterium]|jgi:galactose mutarotase-like enzyme